VQRYTVYLYLETALHILGGTSTHHQECKQLYLQLLVFVTPLLLPAAMAAGSSNSVVTNTRCTMWQEEHLYKYSYNLKARHPCCIFLY